jgi:23S rRNA (guanosine2251-2'-O)-methyltransferase
VAEALRAGRPLHEVVVAGDSGDLGALARMARQAGRSLRIAGRGELDALAAGVAHQGVVAVAADFGYRDLGAVLDGDLVVVCDGITDPQNLGAIARSAEAAGADGLVLARRRSAHVTPAAEKAAAGAFSWLPVVIVANLVRAIAELADHGFWSAGLAGDAGETLWDTSLLDGRVALVVGAEGGGLSRLVAERVDGLVAIPQHGHIESLNASAAAAVTLFEIVRRRAAP